MSSTDSAPVAPVRAVKKGRLVRIAGSIILGVIGAILYFAVTAEVEGVSLDMVGIILMVAAGLWFLIELVVAFTGDRVTSTSTVRAADGTVQPEETRTRQTKDQDER